MNQTLEICSVPSYKINYENTKKYSNNINVISNLLNNDRQLHERLEKNDALKLSVDVDKLTNHNPNASLDKVICDICEYVNITKNEIFYTTNFSVKFGSHHIVIPKFHMLSSKQKQFWKDFQQKYKYGNEIDAGIFDKSGWFRLPNQTKEGVNGTKHIIQQGELEDFVLKYTEKSTELPYEIHTPKENITSEIKENVKQKKNKLVIANADDTEEKQEKNDHKKDKYLNLLFNVIKNEVDDKGNKKIDWDTWFEIAGTLKSNKYKKEVFIEYSKPFGNEKEASTLWDGIKKNEMAIFCLENIAKKINPTGYSDWKKIINKFRFVQDDNSASTLIYEEMKNDLFYIKKRLFLKHKNIWKEDSDFINDFILDYILKSNIAKKNDENIFVPYNQNVKSAKNVREALLVKVRTTDFNNDDIYNKFHTTTKNRICFLDGVLDFKEKQFYKWEDINFEYYSTIQIKRNYHDYFQNPKLETIKKIKDEIYKPLYGSNLDLGLKFLARAITGNCEDKNWGMYHGNRNCGKGVQYGTLKHSLKIM